MGNQNMHLLVTVDERYIRHLQTMLKSFAASNTGEAVHVWLLHSGIPRDSLDLLKAYCHALGSDFTDIAVDAKVFADAPSSKRYPKEMYYRLLAPLLLPESVERILYLDPDILVINSVRPLWETPLDGCAFAAASHSVVPDMVGDVNRMRLGTDHAYFNTGVILMDLRAARELVRPDDIFTYVREHSAELLLPDQDVFNSLYGSSAKQIDDVIWNYDARRFSAYDLASGRKHNMDWVMENTAILHFCGTRKPWKPSHRSRFSTLYKHYMFLAKRQAESLTENAAEDCIG